MGQGDSSFEGTEGGSCVLAPAIAGPLHWQPAYDIELAAQSQRASSCLSTVSTSSSRDDGFTSCSQGLHTGSRFLSLQSPAPLSGSRSRSL